MAISNFLETWGHVEVEHCHKITLSPVVFDS